MKATTFKYNSQDNKNKPNKQDNIFTIHEADAWYERNKKKLYEAGQSNSKTESIIKLIQNLKLSTKGKVLDIGGANGRVSAGIVAENKHWTATVLELSRKAICHGKKTFPKLKFMHGNITQKRQLPKEQYDIVIIRGVFCWIDRLHLTQTIANIDSLVINSGYLIISDFYTPSPRANAYIYSKGVFTFKQDYVLPFLALNIYSEILRKNYVDTKHTKHDNRDPYDIWWSDAILQKDLFGRYRI